MVRSGFVSLYILLICLLVVTACGEKEHHEVTYEKGFPKEDSRPLMEFMKHYLSEDTDQEIQRVNGSVFFSTLDTQRRDIEYFKYTENQLKDYYKPMFTEKNAKKTLRKLNERERFEKLLHHTIENKDKYDLPATKMLPNNQLEVKTTENKTTLDLPLLLKEYGLKKSDNLEIYLNMVNSKCFALVIQDFSMKESNNSTIGLFIKQDLTDIQTTIISPEKLPETLSSGKLEDYYDLFQKVDKQGRYLFLFDDMILDKKTNELVDIKKNDYLSRDGKYVYINGAKDHLEDGMQRIQTIENYAAGNDKYEEQFELDYKTIAQKLDLKENGTSIAEINYFNQDFVVLSLNYRGKFVGTAGFTNVIIDLKNDTAYLVDLDILTQIY
ncbi:hypothetical protein [Bacillus paralicheniformis]|uniref:hypothetical protein n=1 Tax=Bacillus paralicheniformis TaxID=1648923 RepID=UPI00080E4BBD|nr:hypothetical protein [Bacillus paralicheniformis]